MIVRPEASHDYAAIREINLAAFAHHPYSRQVEHLIVEALRADDALTISLVAEVEGRAVGHIAFSPIAINGEHLQWFALGPVAVLPAMQRRGIGKALINEGLKALRSRGAQGCVLVGDLAYYHRFGFRRSPELIVHGVPPSAVLCLPMTPHFPEGKVEHHAAFSI